MALPQLVEMRAHRRRCLVGFMPGRLYTSDRRREIVCRPLDVSPSGLGLFSEEELDEGGKDFILIVAGHEIELELVWSMESPGLRVGYRHGFKAKDPGINLEELCAELGYL